MTAAIIVNPVSGRDGSRAGTVRDAHGVLSVSKDAGERRRALAARAAASAGVAAEIVLTERPGHATALARAFAGRGTDVVVAWGGDGTANEVAGALIGTRTAMGVVPDGSGNGLARGLGLPLDAERALGQALGGATSRIDVGYLGARHFLNIAGIGFDATVSAAIDRRPVRGALAYFVLGARLVWSYRPASYRVELPGGVREGPHFLVAFANGREYGNAATLAPDADPADGWLDVVAVTGGSAYQQIWRARRLVMGHRRPAHGVFRGRAQAARVSGKTLVCHVDGEAFETSGSLDVRIEPGALLVRGSAQRSPH